MAENLAPARLRGAQRDGRPDQERRGQAHEQGAGPHDRGLGGAGVKGVVGEPRDPGVPCGACCCHARAAGLGQRERMAVEGRVAAAGQGGDESRGEVGQLDQARLVRGVADDKPVGGAARAPRARGQDRHLGAGGLVVGQGGDDDASTGARLLLDHAQGLVEGGDPLGVGGGLPGGVDDGEVRVGDQGIGHRRRHGGGHGR